MSNSQQSRVDSELASCGNGGGGSGGGAGAVGGGGEQSSSDAIEIVRVEEINGSGDGEKHERKESSVSECSVEIGDLVGGGAGSKVHLGEIERECRICQLSTDVESGIPIDLGCSCKDDLAAAHKQCAEAWFKIKGNKICEICGSIAQNVAGVVETESTEQWNETVDVNATATTSASQSQSRNFWHGHRFLNFLLACMVFAFVISWLFHFNVPS